MKKEATTEETRLVDSPEVLDLVARCGRGDEAALADFFDRFAEDMYNFPIKVFHLDADAASDFFLYAFERLREGNRFGSFQGRSSFRTWFYTVLRNLVIDWMRTIREVQTVNPTWTDGAGNETPVIEGTPARQIPQSDEDLLERFRCAIADLSLELRTVFKLSYIYYLELEPDEVGFLVEKSGLTLRELAGYLADLKGGLAEREMRNLDSEDKITSLFLSISDMRNRQDRLSAENASDLDPVAAEFESEKLERALQKKQDQRSKLLEKRSKGHFLVRTPYRHVTELLGVPEGSVSVQMMRALERIRDGAFSDQLSV